MHALILIELFTHASLNQLIKLNSLCMRALILNEYFAQRALNINDKIEKFTL